MGCHFFLQGIFLNPGIKPGSPALQADALPSEPPGNPYVFLENPILILKVSECNTQNKVRVLLPPEEKGQAAHRLPWEVSSLSSPLAQCLGTSQALGLDCVVACSAAHTEPCLCTRLVLSSGERNSRSTGSTLPPLDAGLGADFGS